MSNKTEISQVSSTKSMETTRLILRKPSQSDVDSIFTMRESEYVRKYNAMDSKTKEELLEGFKKQDENSNVFYMEEKESGRVIGAVFVEPDSLRYGVKSACLSYYLEENSSGKGFMTEALRTVIKYLFLEKNTDVVSARVFSENTASQSLLKKLGFIHEGTLRHCVCGHKDIIYDDMVFSILKTEFLGRA